MNAIIGYHHAKESMLWGPKKKHSQILFLVPSLEPLLSSFRFCDLALLLTWDNRSKYIEN
jgi:hypothetical protein